MSFLTKIASWILDKSGTMMLYAGATMFLAQLVFLTYITYAWGINKQRLYNIMAVAQGIDITQTEEKLRASVSDKIAEIHYDDVLSRRAERIRQDEFLATNMQLTAEQVGGQERIIEGKYKTLIDRIAAFEKRLTDVEKKAKDAGITEEIAIFDALKPDAAKDAIMAIIRDERDVDRAVIITKGMDITKRAKMLGAMQTEDEKKELVNLLQLIGDGVPITPVVAASRAEMENDKTPTTPATPTVP
ncbi:MAG: hypothetical protein ACRC46_09435 [Thermoguttaceae bacterium]